MVEATDNSNVPSTELQEHWNLMYTNRVELLVTFFVSFVVYWVFAILLKFIFDYRAKYVVRFYPNTAAQTYLDLSSVKRWEYL